MTYDVNNVTVTVGGVEVEAYDVPDEIIEVVRNNGLDVNLEIPVDRVTINGETWIKAEDEHMDYDPDKVQIIISDDDGNSYTLTEEDINKIKSGDESYFELTPKENLGDT